MKLSIYRKYPVPGGYVVDDVAELEYHAEQIEFVDRRAMGKRFMLISANERFEIVIDNTNYKYIISA